jgi:toxin YoeB
VAETAWEDYLYWQSHDKKVLKRINTLIKEISRQPFTGIGDPEPLKHHWSGYWSRRIDLEHRLVYKVSDGEIVIVQCRYHY